MTDKTEATRGLYARLEAFAFGPRPPRNIPGRAKEGVARAQQSAELLLTLMQIGAIVFFTVVYFAAPKAFPSSAPFEPVPILLAAYTVFTGVRFWLTISDRLSRSVQFASIAIDIAVLMMTIWSFHLQYEVSPAVYLKAPTLLYVFILIVLRALRMEADQVLFAGAMAILGYAGLVGYALRDAGADMITRDWAIYMTSSNILIGAEVDKLLAIAIVSAVLAIAVIRARRMLLIAAVERHAAEELSRFFPPRVADAIRAADLDRERIGMRREAAVMMVDLRNFSEISAALSPTETLSILTEYQALIVPIVHRYGGSVDKYLGDGVLVTFGAIEESDSFADEALAAMRDILTEGAVWEAARQYRGEPSPSVVVALDVGRLTLGVVGADGRLEFTIIGDVVNRVAKLEKHARALRTRGVVSTRAVNRASATPPELELVLQSGEEVLGLAAPMDLMTAAVT